MSKWKAILQRAYKTLIQSAIGSAASAAIVAIGSAKTMEQVNWLAVLSTAGLSFVVAVLWNIKANLPEVEIPQIEDTEEE